MSKNSGIKVDPSQLSVLVVDDHPQIRKAMVKVLESEKFGEINEVGTGNEALKILSESHMDLVVLDLYLNDISGFDVLEYIRNRSIDSDIPVIVVTGEASKEEIVKAADIGANDYLLKPFKSDDFEIKIAKVVNKYQSPTEIIKLQRRAERFYIDKKYQEALEVLQDCLKVDGESVAVRHLKAMTLDKVGEAEAAKQILLKNAELNDSFYKTFAVLADIYIREGNTAEAIEHMKQELLLNPKQPRRQTQLANMLLKQGQIEVAIQHLREALKENIRYKQALKSMGKAYAAMDNLDKCIYYFRRIRRYYPTDTKCLESIVKFSLDAGEPRKAEYALRDEKGANKSRLDTYLVLAKLYLATDEKEKALATVEDLLKLKPDSIPGLKLKAAIHMRFDEHQPAIEIYKQLLEETDDPETRVQFADILLKCQNYLSAIQILHGITRKKIDQRAIIARLATAFTNTNQVGKAHLVYMLLAKKNALGKSLFEGAKLAQKNLKLRRIQATKRVAS